MADAAETGITLPAVQYTPLPLAWLNEQSHRAFEHACRLNQAAELVEWMRGLRRGKLSAADGRKLSEAMVEIAVTCRSAQALLEHQRVVLDVFVRATVTTVTP